MFSKNILITLEFSIFCMIACSQKNSDRNCIFHNFCRARCGWDNPANGILPCHKLQGVFTEVGECMHVFFFFFNITHRSIFYLFFFLFRYKMKESSIDEFSCKQIPHLLSFWVTSSEGFGLLQTVFRPGVNPLNDIFATKISSNHLKSYLPPKLISKTFFFCWPNWLEREKERINKLSIGLICFKMICLRYCPAGKTK